MSYSVEQQGISTMNQVECNWKVFVDNYLDGGYHVQHLHKDLAAALSIGESCLAF